MSLRPDGDALPAKARGRLKETLVPVAQALIIALIFRTFLFQSVNIPSESMKPTLLVGDFLFVNKFAYGYANVSLPFAPDLVSGRVFGKGPERGDIVVFRGTRGDGQDYIKRVIGLPGDRVQMQGGVLVLNGVPVPKVAMDDFADESGRFRRFRETLPNGVSYMVLDLYANGDGDDTTLYTVPDGHYFMMGDNRDNSADSRFAFAMGYVPFANLVGRADLRYFSLRPHYRFWAFWEWPQAVRWSRLVTRTHQPDP